MEVYRKYDHPIKVLYSVIQPKSNNRYPECQIFSIPGYSFISVRICYFLHLCAILVTRMYSALCYQACQGRNRSETLDELQEVSYIIISISDPDQHRSYLIHRNK